MQAKHKRTLRTGKEYDQYFNPATLQRKDPIIHRNGDVFDTIVAMADLVRKTLPDTATIAPVLKGDNLEATCRNIFDFVYHHIQYTLDTPGVEQLRTPLRTWADRKAGVDCDCYSIFISSILTNLNIPHVLRMTKYAGDWQHIYVIVPKQPGSNLKDKRSYYTLDCVLDSFNYEVPYSDKHDKPMGAIQVLNGLPTEDVAIPGFGAEFVAFGKSTISGLGAVQTAADLRDDFLERTKLHLENTRDILKKSKLDPAFMSQINQVLAVWHDATRRDALLDRFAAQERQMAGLGQLGGLWDSIKKGVSNATNWVSDKANQAANAVKEGVKNAADWTGDKAGDAWEGVKNAAEWTWDAIKKYNPLFVAMRNGLLLAFKINLFKMSERLGWGYLTEAQAVKAGMKATEYKKLKEKLDKVIKIHDGMEGDLGSLKKNILEGWEKGTDRKFTSLHGLGEPVTGTTIATAMGIITSILAMLKGILTPNPQNPQLPPPDYSAYTTVPTNYTPGNDASYVTNPDTPPTSNAGSDNTMLYVGVAAAIAAVALID